MYSQAAGLISHNLVKKFGGYTFVSDCEGGWQNPDTMEIETESVNIWEVYTTDSHVSTMRHMEALATYVRELTGEHTVMITVNHDAMFVSDD